MSNSDSTTDDDCRFDSPCAATALIRSFLVSAVTSSRPFASPDSPSLRRPLREKSLVPLAASSSRAARRSSDPNSPPAARREACPGPGMAVARPPAGRITTFSPSSVSRLDSVIASWRLNAGVTATPPDTGCAVPRPLSAAVDLRPRSSRSRRARAAVPSPWARRRPAPDRCHLDREARVAERLGERVGVLLLLEGADLDPVAPGAASAEGFALAPRRADSARRPWRRLGRAPRACPRSSRAPSLLPSPEGARPRFWPAPSSPHAPPRAWPAPSPAAALRAGSDGPAGAPSRSGLRRRRRDGRRAPRLASGGAATGAAGAGAGGGATAGGVGARRRHRSGSAGFVTPRRRRRLEPAAG